MNSEAIRPTAEKAVQQPAGFAIVLLMLLTLVIRFVHLGSAVDSPFTYHLGPDEDYYLRFGQWVAGIAAGDTAEFAFMDPAYGYLAGLVFKLFGANSIAVLFLQALVDTSTAFCIFLIGRELGRPRGGLYAAFLYALTATAVLYTATFLKATWVANAMVLWTLMGLVLLRTGKAYPWLLFGLFCGYCVALRSNLILMVFLGIALLPWLHRTLSDLSGRATAIRTSLLVTGFLVPVLILAARNEGFSGKFTPLPNNGGTVLHQVYNEDNPRAESWYPPFAPYTHPTEILRGYANEAERRTGRSMTPGEVNDYWASRARDYILAQPATVARNIGRKSLEFAAHTEVANNRSLLEERLFSPVLRLLPSPFGWLFAFGLPGLFLLTRRNRRGLLTLVPVLVVLATFAVFFAEARFRFHAVPMLALGAGLFIEDLVTWLRRRQFRPFLLGLVATLLLGGLSAWATQQVSTPAISWDAVVWGYIKMGDLPAAESTVANVDGKYRDSAKWEEALGFLAWSRKDHHAAANHYERAVQLNPGSHVAHYNLAMMLTLTGEREKALSHAGTALQIAPLPEYRRLLEELSGQ